jgi:hypothetical protein
MAQYYIQPTVPHLLPHSLILGSSHVVEIKKGGLHVGIYVITSSLRRRGVILPVDVWTALVSSVDAINFEIDCMRGIPLGTTSASSIFDYGFIEEGGQYNVTPNNGNTAQPITIYSQQNAGNEE